MARQHGADAVQEGIAGGEHADLPAAQRQHLVDRRASNGVGHGRAAPRISGAASAEMALAAEHDRRAAHEAARHRAEPVDAVLADADDGQPARAMRQSARQSDQQAP